MIAVLKCLSDSSNIWLISIDISWLAYLIQLVIFLVLCTTAFFFFLLVLETLGPTQIFYFIRQSPCLASPLGSYPIFASCGFPVTIHVSKFLWGCFGLFGLSSAVGALLVSTEVVWKGIFLDSWAFLCRNGLHVFLYRFLPAALVSLHRGGESEPPDFWQKVFLDEAACCRWIFSAISAHPTLYGISLCEKESQAWQRREYLSWSLISGRASHQSSLLGGDRLYLTLSKALTFI